MFECHVKARSEGPAPAWLQRSARLKSSKGESAGNRGFDLRTSPGAEGPRSPAAGTAVGHSQAEEPRVFPRPPSSPLQRCRGPERSWFSPTRTEKPQTSAAVSLGRVTGAVCKPCVGGESRGPGGRGGLEVTQLCSTAGRQAGGGGLYQSSPTAGKGASPRPLQAASSTQGTYTLLAPQADSHTYRPPTHCLPVPTSSPVPPAARF